MEDVAWIAGLSLVAALGLGVPLRLFGWRGVWNGALAGLAFLRRYRWRLLSLLVAGAIAGLWTFEDVRSLVFSPLWR